MASSTLTRNPVSTALKTAVDLRLCSHTGGPACDCDVIIDAPWVPKTTRRRAVNKAQANRARRS